MTRPNRRSECNIGLSHLRNAISAGQPIRLKIISPSDAEKDLFVQLQWSDHWIEYELIKALGQMPEIVVTDHQPNAVLHLFGFPTPLDPRIYTMGWIYGHPDLLTDFELAQYDHLFCYSDRFLKELNRRGYQAELMIGATAKQPRHDVKLRYHATFVGNARPQGGGRPAVDALLESGESFLVWGHGWKGRLPQKNFAGEYYDFGRLEELYAASEFSLNDHHPDMRRWGFVSFRLYDILGSGGFAVSDRNDGISEIFGDSVPQFSDGRDLQEIFAHFRAHPEERERLRQEGMQAALSHTWQKRAEQIRQHFLRISQPQSEVVDITAANSSMLEDSPTGHRATTFEQGSKPWRLFYVDWFAPENQSVYWLNAFRKYADVEVFYLRADANELENKIRSFDPDHIHLGNVVRQSLLSTDLFRQIKARTGCAITAFSSDAAFSGYLMDLARVADRIYITNSTHVKLNAEKELKNFSYLPCPTDPEVFRPHNAHNAEKIHDLLFIGNNNNQSRLDLLERLSEWFNLAVAGHGWEGTGLKSLPAVYGEDFSRLCAQSRISLGLISDEWQHLEGYFTSRLTNTLACGAFLIQRYTPGLEKIFTHGQHLVWFKTQDELSDLIRAYLPNDQERQVIAEQGRKEVLGKYTFDQQVALILEDVKAKRRIRQSTQFPGDIGISGKTATRMPENAPQIILSREQLPNEFFQPVFIVGFHHSGTRLLAQLLRQFGVFQVVDRPTYEWGYIQNLNTTILPGWNDPRAVREFDAELGSHQISLEDVFYLLSRNGYQDGQSWAHKDPRTCATLPAWLKVFPQARVVHIIRDPLDVLGTISDEYSIFTPGGEIPQRALPFWAELWRSYIDKVLACAPQVRNFAEMRFEDMYNRPLQELERITRALDLRNGKPVDTSGIQPGKIGIHKKWIADGKLDPDEVERLRTSLADYRKKYAYSETFEAISPPMPGISVEATLAV